MNTPGPRSDIPPDAAQTGNGAGVGKERQERLGMVGRGEDGLGEAGTAHMRVQIPAYHDAWARGDRFGVVVKIVRVPTNSFEKMEASGIGMRARILTKSRYNGVLEVAHVLMDKTNKVRRVILADCEVVS